MTAIGMFFSRFLRRRLRWIFAPGVTRTTRTIFIGIASPVGVLNGWEALEAIALAGKTTVSVESRRVVFEGDERVRATPKLDAFQGDFLKSEIRNPNPERNPNAEIRTNAVLSGFGFLSDFGFRISDLERVGLSQWLLPQSGKILFESAKLTRKFRTE